LIALQQAGVPTGSQKGDVYSFAIVTHEIIYRSGLFRCADSDQPIPAKSKSATTVLKTVLISVYGRFPESRFPGKT